jgi:hypothetical protein
MKFFTRPARTLRLRGRSDRPPLKTNWRAAPQRRAPEGDPAKTPPWFRELQELYPHACVLAGLPCFHPAFQMKLLPEMIWGFPFWERKSEAAPNGCPSFLMALQLDPPRKRFLSHYRFVRIDEISRHRPPDDDRCRSWNGNTTS